MIHISQLLVQRYVSYRKHNRFDGVSSIAKFSENMPFFTLYYFKKISESCYISCTGTCSGSNQFEKEKLRRTERKPFLSESPSADPPQRG